MLKSQHRFIRNLFSLMDILIVAGSWILYYFFLENYPQLTEVEHKISFKEHLLFLMPVVITCIVVFDFFRLHEPKRTINITGELLDIIKAAFIYVVIIGFISDLNIFNIDYKHYYSRISLLFLCAINIVVLSFFRVFLRLCLRAIRKSGYNLRHILIVGTGSLAKEVALRIDQHREFGLEISGFLARDPEHIDSLINGHKVVGCYKDLTAAIDAGGIDQLIFALPQDEHRLLMKLLGLVSGSMVDISVIPDIRYKFFTLRQGVEEFAGLPLIRLRETPLFGWNGAQKRIFDFCVALFSLTMIMPFMIIIAVIIKLESKGPIFYKQKRVGYDGREFEIIKFRSMRQNAESETGAVWAQKDDPRSTKLGKILRKTSIDEIPQLLNVIKGEMSLIGPRPERPEFIGKFRGQIPAYMLRHKMKAGMTGWAQVHGLRGNTSLEKRIEYDIYYIEHWSLLLDIRIIFLTVPLIFMEPEYSLRFKDSVREV